MCIYEVIFQTSVSQGKAGLTWRGQTSVAFLIAVEPNRSGEKGQGFWHPFRPHNSFTQSSVLSKSIRLAEWPRLVWKLLSRTFDVVVNSHFKTEQSIVTFSSAFGCFIPYASTTWLMIDSFGGALSELCKAEAYTHYAEQQIILGAFLMCGK